MTGFLDSEMANIMQAYFESVAARLSGGHQPEWRKEFLDVLEERYRRTIAAWDAVADVKRIVQGYDDDCAWTFETSLPDASKKTGLTL
ncbi:hypothetical protein ACJ73_03398 [Blastomyces percursus]|uniref:Uncharacterized protein n=1 Tax=Blastomyces percursus TaxID=1658174 RepID=A0A1J9Q9W2_9EURO|nr:hypothetical protein ACJ73_03398 [Blastomyces percursus]